MNQETPEVKRYRERTRKSLAEFERAGKRLPLGVNSNFRAYPPYPFFVDRAAGTRLWDVDGNQYIDFGLCFGALMAGHSHPKVAEAITAQIGRGTLYGMPHRLEIELAEEICGRFPIDQVRFGQSGTEATMHALRVARGFTGRSKILKFEGAYHGGHDYALVSFKPPLSKAGRAAHPRRVPAGAGIPAETVSTVLAATFNDLNSVRRAMEEHEHDVAAIILEPVMMNIGLVLPEKGFLEGLRQICDEFGSLLIFDEVKTGVKLAYGGASEYFGVKPDMVTMAKSFGGGVPIAGFGARREIMDELASFQVFHAGTYNGNPLCLAAAVATLKHVITREVYPRINDLNQRLTEGYNRIIQRHGLPAHALRAGANGCVYFRREPVRNYRDWLGIDREMFWGYWFGMLNRGIIPQATGYDDQWTISVVHREEEIDLHLKAFDEVAGDIARG